MLILHGISKCTYLQILKEFKTHQKKEIGQIIVKGISHYFLKV